MRDYRKKSLADQLQRMELAIANAQQPAHIAVLQPYGYTEVKLKALQQLLSETKQLQNIQEKEYGQQLGATNSFEEKSDALNSKYMRHVKLSRIELENDIEALSMLGIVGERKKAYAAWINQVEQFYAQLGQNKALAQKLKAVNIQQNDIEQGMALIAELKNLKHTQNREMAEAQRATEQRDVKLDELYKGYSRPIKIARVAFEEDAQQLESLGVVVKR